MSATVPSATVLPERVLPATVLPERLLPERVLTAPRDILPAVPGLTLTSVGPGVWRVCRAHGPVLGHIQRRPRDGVDRYVARRLVGGSIRSMELGEFWSATDAAECFR
jgi:hypothetical protein